MFVFNVLVVTETKAQGALNEILKRMENHRATLKTLESKLTMIKHDALLDENDVFQGTVKYIPGQSDRDIYIRIDWTKPDEKLAVIKTDYVLYRPRLEQAIVGKVDKAKNSAGAGGALGFMSMSKAQLKANYSYKYLGEEKLSSGAKTVRLELTPKNKQKYKSAELWVDYDGMPLQMKVVENNNDSTTVLLYDVKKNPTLNASDFEIRYPKNTKIVKG
ncbi:MAG TPA: outer membrane lipoprotein carrier protein LolA [Pyrinomonadaceae bacterium]|jgi:outer membrane lipoprotein-sorting protein